MSDELLVVRCQLGERDAFADLVRRWRDEVAAYVRRMLGSADVDDVTQEVWLAVVRGLPRLRQPDRFAPWLFTIARRAVANRLRAEYARPEVLDAEPTAEDDSVWVADRAAVAAGLAGLPVREREVLVLFYLHDLSVDGCAQVCGVPAGTVKSRLSRARRLLRAALIEKGFSA